MIDPAITTPRHDDPPFIAHCRTVCRETAFATYIEYENGKVEADKSLPDLPTEDEELVDGYTTAAPPLPYGVKYRVPVVLFTGGAVVQVYDALNEANKVKLLMHGPAAAIDLTWKVLERQRG